VNSKLLTLLWCLGCMPSWAADEIDAYYFTLSLEELLAVEVSGASFSIESPAYTPASVTVFTAKEIQQLGLRNLHELSNLVPGFQSKRQSENGLYSVSSRGRQIGTSTRSVKIIINGQAITTGYIGSSMGSISKVPLDNVSKIEFIRGPGSVVYGSGALLGVINIETYRDENFAQVGFGNHDYASSVVNYFRGDLQFSAIFRGDLGEKYSLKDSDSGNRVDSQDPYSESYFYLIKRDDKNIFSLHHNRLNNRGYYSVDRVDNDINGLDKQYTLASFSHTSDINDQFDLISQVYANIRKIGFSGRLSAPGALAGVSQPSNVAPIEVNSAIESKQYGVKVVADWLFIDGHLTVGGEYQYSDPASSLMYSNFNLEKLAAQEFPLEYYDNDPVPFPLIREKDNHVFSWFAEYQQQVTPRFNTIYSLRYDYAKNIGEGELLPRLALIYELTENHYLKALYSKAFRTPDAIELYAINNNALIGNQDLSSETITSSELVWFSQYSNFYFNLAYFYNQIDNAIEQTSVAGVRTFQNKDEESNDGLELEYRHQINRDVSIRASYSRMLNMLNSSFRVSDTTGSITLSGQHKRWQANVSSVYLSRSDMLMNANNDRLTLPAYWYHNLAVNYQHNEELNSQLLINNLQDKNYLTPTASTNLDEGLPARGREIIYSVKLRF